MIDTPPFPPLKWDSYQWVGEVVLPSWAGFQRRSATDLSLLDRQPSDGTARLEVESERPRRLMPAKEQATAFRHLLDNEPTVAAAVGQALLAYYTPDWEVYAERHDLWGSPEVWHLPVVTAVVELRPLLGLAAIRVLSVVNDGTAYVGFVFGCVWDEGHGVGVLTHRGRVVATGLAGDICLSRRVASQDAAQQLELSTRPQEAERRAAPDRGRM